MIVHKRGLFFTLLCHRFSSSTRGAKPEKRLIFQCINEIPHCYKSKAIEEAQKVLREYLHGTKSLPFVFAELIANNSPFSLSKLFRRVHFSVPNFSKTLRRLLRYEPINEFEFFLESIGIEYHKVHRYLPANKFFFSEDSTALNVSFSLSQFGFPWNTLGKLYEEEALIFSKSSDELCDRLSLFRERYGLDSLYVAGVCLAFPHLLRFEGDLGDDVDEIFRDLKRVFVEFGGESCVEGNVDAWYELCCKVRVFHELGCEKGKVGELMCERKDVFLGCPTEVLVRKVEFFSKFGVRKVDIGLLLLQSPEILNLDVETPAISVLRLLEHFGLSSDDLKLVSAEYSHVMGRNEMANLPCVMRALDLHEWCFDKIRSSNGRLLATYSVSSFDEEVDKDFADAMKRLASSRLPVYMIGKVNFMKRIGFGENASTLKVLKFVTGSGDELQERFNCLLRIGMVYSKLCLSIRTSPKLLNQCPESLERKVNFLCGEMGSSLDYISNFPAVLCFDLDRMKYRCRFYAWLRATGLWKKNYKVATMVATSERTLVINLLGIHPALPKQYLECFSYKRFLN